MTMSTRHFHVLVLGRGVYALPLLRVLGSKSLEDVQVTVTFGTTVGITDVPSLSNHIDSVMKLPRPDRDLNAYSKAICGFVSTHANPNTKLIITPVAEESLFLAEIAPQIREAAGNTPLHIQVSPIDLMAKLNDKFQFQKLVQSVFGTEHTPRTTLVHTHQSPQQWRAAVKQTLSSHAAAPAVVLKPIIGHGGRGAHVIKREQLEAMTDDEFRQAYYSEAETASEPYVVQEFVEGKEYSTYSFIQNGVVVAHSCYNPRYVKKIGFSPIRSVAPTSVWKSTLDWVQKFASKHSLDGHYGFDVMERYNGSIAALECNPRVTNGIAFLAPRYNLETSQALQQVYLGLATNKDVLYPLAQDVPHITTLVPTISCLLKAKNASERMQMAELVSEAKDDIWWWKDPLPFVSTLFRLFSTLGYAILMVLLGQGPSVTHVVRKTIVEEIVEYTDVAADSKTTKSETVGGLQWDLSTRKSNRECRILITGATGFLGGRLVKILANGYDDPSIELPEMAKKVTHITATGRNEKIGKELIESIDPSTTKKKIQFVKADLSDAAATFRLVQGHDIVIHSAALCSLWTKWENYIAANTTAAENIVHACHMTGVKMLVHVSSPSLTVPVDTGDRINALETDPVPSDEKQPNRYAATKKLAEDIVLDVTKRYQLPCVILRPRALFGPGDTTLFPLIVDRLSKNKLPIIGGKEGLGDFTYIDNVAHGCLCAMNAKPTETRIYSITNDDPRKLWDVIDRIVNHMKFRQPWKRLPISVAYAAASMFELGSAVLMLFGIQKTPLLTRYNVNILSRSSTFDITAAKKDLGYKPVVSFDEGVQIFLDSVQS